MDLRNYFFNLRQSLNMTREEFALKVGYSALYIRQIEYNTYPVSLNYAIRVIDAFKDDLSFKELMKMTHVLANNIKHSHHKPDFLTLRQYLTLVSRDFNKKQQKLFKILIEA